MNISPEDAREALFAIQQTTERSRSSVMSSGYQLINWGIVWFVGFLACQFLRPELLGWVWGPLILAGCAVSTVMSVRQERQVRSVFGPRIGMFFFTLILFSALWVVLMGSGDVRQIAVFLVTVVMFGCIAIGIWLRIPLQIGVGAGVVVLAVAGYYMIPAYFWLCVAVLCGGSLIGSGIYVVTRWREPWQN